KYSTITFGVIVVILICVDIGQKLLNSVNGNFSEEYDEFKMLEEFYSSNVRMLEEEVTETTIEQTETQIENDPSALPKNSSENSPDLIEQLTEEQNQLKKRMELVMKFLNS